MFLKPLRQTKGFRDTTPLKTSHSLTILDQILVQQKSADGMLEVILYHRSCANNTGLYTCADLAKASGNLSAEKERQTVLTIKGFHEIAAIWTGPKSLEIISAGLKNQKDILTQEKKWKNILISYKDLER